MRDLVDEGDLVKVRVDLLGYFFGFLHMHDHLGLLEHRLECLPTPPLLAGLSQDVQLWLLNALRKCADTLDANAEGESPISGRSGTRSRERARRLRVTPPGW